MDFKLNAAAAAAMAPLFVATAEGSTLRLSYLPALVASSRSRKEGGVAQLGAGTQYSHRPAEATERVIHSSTHCFSVGSMAADGDDATATRSSKVKKKKKPYKELTLEEKVELIRLAESCSNLSQASIAEKYSIAKSNVCRILQRRTEYLQAYECAGFSGSRKRKLRAFISATEAIPLGQKAKRWHYHQSSVKISEGQSLRSHLLKEHHLQKNSNLDCVKRRAGVEGVPLLRTANNDAMSASTTITGHHQAPSITCTSGDEHGIVHCGHRLGATNSQQQVSIITCLPPPPSRKLLAAESDEDVDVNVVEEEVIGPVFKISLTQRDMCQSDSDGGESSPLSQHTSSSMNSSSQSVMSPPRDQVGDRRREDCMLGDAAGAGPVSGNGTAAAIVVACERCVALKHHSDVAQARNNYLEIFTIGLQSEILSIGANLTLTEQMVQKLERQKNHLSMENSVFKLKLLECRDKVLALVKIQQRNLLLLGGDDRMTTFEFQTRPLLERVLTENVERLGEILSTLNFV